MLTVKINLEKNTENLLAVLKALSEFDIETATWDDDPKPEVVEPRHGKDADLGSSLSNSINRKHRQIRDGNI